MEKAAWEWMGSCTESPQRGLTQATVQCCCTARFWKKSSVGAGSTGAKENNYASKLCVRSVALMVGGIVFCRSAVLRSNLFTHINILVFSIVCPSSCSVCCVDLLPSIQESECIYQEFELLP